MKKLILISMLVFIPACGNMHMESVPDATVAANKRWNQTRAKMMCGVAAEQLNAGQLDQAIVKAQQALELDPDCVEASLLLARAQIEQGDQRSAEARLIEVLQSAPDNADAQYLLGVAQERAGRLEDALASYRKTRAINPDSMPAVLASAEVLVSLNRLREAELLIQANSPRAGEDPSLFEIGGRIAMMRKDYSGAVCYYLRATDLDSKNRAYRNELAHAQFLAGRHADALETLNAMVEADSASVQPWQHAMRGDCLIILNHSDKAVEAYKLACKADPTSANLLVKLAQAQLASGDSRTARQTAGEAFHRDRSSAEASIVLGYALIREDQSQQAIEVLTFASGRHADNATIWCLLGKAYQNVGNSDEATKCFVAARQAAPENPLVRELSAVTTPGEKTLSRLP